MTTQYVSKRFGIMLMDGEELLFEAAPNGFVRYSVIVGLMTIFGILLTPITWLFATIAQTKFRYWLTNRRVVLASGFLGYTVRSIPLERVSDVALSNTFPEMVSGIQSVIVRDMTGEAQSGKWLFAVDNAPEVQRRILEEVQRVNAEKRGI